jgi:predicted permease
MMRRLRRLFHKQTAEKQLDAELRYHVERQTADYVATGMSAEEARQRVREEIGAIEIVKQDCREARRMYFLEGLMQDLRFGLRMLRKNPGFTTVAVLTLALGIGANTAIFSLMDSILLRSLPVADPQSLVLLSWHTPRPEFHGSDRHDDDFNDPKGGYIGGAFAYPAFELLQKGDSVFSSVFGYQNAGKLNLLFRGLADLASTEYVSGGYFSGLGTHPAAGRLIGPDDDRAGAPPVAVISYALSERNFGGPANAPGQSIQINNLPFTVVGVTSPEFFGADPDMPPDIYIPMHADQLLEADSPATQPNTQPNWMFIDPNYDWVIPIARLRPGVTPMQAQAALAGAFYEWGHTAKPQVKPQEIPTLVVREGASGLDSLRRRYSKPLYILLTLVGLILAIACANIANLLLARAATRKREIAVRLSMGAGRLRLIRLFLTESVLLALLGGAVGVGVAVWGIRFITLLLANGQENFTLRADLNWHVLAAVAALSLFTGVLFGLVPSLQSTRVDLVSALKESRTGDVPWRGFRRLSLSRILIVSQIAIALLIVVAAGLFVRTLSNLASVNLGFNGDNVLTFQLNARQAGHKDPEIIAFYEDLQRQFSAIPGVQSASIAHQLLLGMGTSAGAVRLPDGTIKSSRKLSIGTGFFNTMHIPILRGRDIEARDRSGSPMVAVINEAFAKLAFGDRNPLGQHLNMPGACSQCDVEVVGVVANSLYGKLKGTMQPIVYLPFTQGAWGPVQQMFFELRTAGNPLGYVAAVRDIVRRADDRVPLADVKTQRAWIDQTISQEITFARLCSALAVLALAIACVGLYGTMSYNVSRRTSEIGIRMALGAQRRRVIWMVLREVIVLAAVGLAISLPVALLASKLLQSFLFGMKSNDPLTLTGAAVTLVCAAILAGYLPARSASRIDPMAALRQE